MKAQLKTKVSPVQEIMEELIEEGYSELAALELIMSERTGEQFDIWDYELGEVKYGDYYNSSWYQEVYIIGSRDSGWDDEEEIEAIQWNVTDSEAEPYCDVSGEDLNKYFDEIAVYRFENEGKAYSDMPKRRITAELVATLEFTEEELRKAACEAQDYYLPALLVYDDFIFEDDAVDELNESIYYALQDIIVENWSKLKDAGILHKGTVYEESVEDYPYEDEEDGHDENCVPLSYLEDKCEPFYPTVIAQELIIEKLRSI